MTITKTNTPESLFPVYEALMDFLKVAGYETKDLTISQLASIKISVTNAIEATDLTPSDYIKYLGPDSQITFKALAGE
jgi:hypothetical protein